MDPSVGHLYHDSSITGTFTSIDAKEQLRMRGVNAREQRHLDRQNYIIDKAKTICEKSRNWEQAKMLRLMRTLRDRTPSLEFLLKEESQSSKKNLFESKFMASLPTLVSRKSMLAVVSPKDKSAADTYLRKPDSDSKPNIFKSRSNRIVRTLVQLYDRSDERKRHPHFRLAPAQVVALEKARITLRGTGAEADVEQLLSRSQGVRYWNPIGQIPTESNQSKCSCDSRQGDPSSSTQSVLEDDACSQPKDDSSMMWTRFPKLPQFNNQRSENTCQNSGTARD